MEASSYEAPEIKSLESLKGITQEDISGLLSGEETRRSLYLALIERIEIYYREIRIKWKVLFPEDSIVVPTCVGMIHITDFDGSEFYRVPHM